MLTNPMELAQKRERWSEVSMKAALESMSRVSVLLLRTGGADRDPIPFFRLDMNSPRIKMVKRTVTDTPFRQRQTFCKDVKSQ